MITRCFLAIVFLFAVTACTEKPVEEVSSESTEAVPYASASSEAEQEALVASAERGYSKPLEQSPSVSQSSESYNSYSSASLQNVDPIGNLSSSETHSLCSEGCSAMGASGSTYSECVSSCTQE